MTTKISKGTAFLFIAGVLVAAFVFMVSGAFDRLPGFARVTVVLVALISCFSLWYASLS